MRGEVTLQVLDSKSGVVKRQIKAHNMVTKAVENIINEQLFRRLVSHELNYHSSNKDIIQDLFGGVMLFDVKLNTQHLFASPDEASHMIGNAGDSSVLTMRDKHNGTLISVVTEPDVAIFTWVFDEDACIGDINSIALTNVYAGQIGCNAETIDKTRINSSFITDANYPNNFLQTLYSIFDLDIRNYTANGLFYIDDNNIVKIDTDNSIKYTTDFSKYADKKLWLDATQWSPFITRLSCVSEQITVDTNYKNISGALTDHAFQMYCTSTTYGAHTMYILHVRKWSSSGYEDFTLYLTNLVTSIYNLYQSKGLVDENTPTSAEDILAGINSAIDNDLVFMHEDKIIWVLGNYQSDADINYTAIAVMDLEGNYNIIDVDDADSYYYDMLGGELHGLLLDKTNISNTLFTTACIDDELYLESDNAYFFIDITSTDKYIYSRPQLYCKGIKNKFKRFDVDKYTASPYYMIAGDSRYKVGVSTANNLYSCVALRTNYLATIQNLERPVAKSTSEVFKLVYKLTR